MVSQSITSASSARGSTMTQATGNPAMMKSATPWASGGIAGDSPMVCNQRQHHDERQPAPAKDAARPRAGSTTSARAGTQSARRR